VCVFAVDSSYTLLLEAECCWLVFWIYLLLLLLLLNKLLRLGVARTFYNTSYHHTTITFPFFVTTVCFSLVLFSISSSSLSSFLSVRLFDETLDICDHIHTRVLSRIVGLSSVVSVSVYSFVQIKVIPKESISNTHYLRCSYTISTQIPQFWGYIFYFVNNKDITYIAAQPQQQLW
jgi:hypothetical protein